MMEALMEALMEAMEAIERAPRAPRAKVRLAGGIGVVAPDAGGRTTGSLIGPEAVQGAVD